MRQRDRRCRRVLDFQFSTGDWWAGPQPLLESVRVLVDVEGRQDNHANHQRSHGNPIVPLPHRYGNVIGYGGSQALADRGILAVERRDARVKMSVPIVLPATNRVRQDFIRGSEVRHPSMCFILRAGKTIGMIPLGQGLVRRANDNILGARVNAERRVVVRSWVFRHPFCARRESCDSADARLLPAWFLDRILGADYLFLYYCVPLAAHSTFVGPGSCFSRDWMIDAGEWQTPRARLAGIRHCSLQQGARSRGATPPRPHTN